MPHRRPADLLAALGALTPSVASAGPLPAIDIASGAPHPLGWIAIAIAASLLVGAAVLLATGRLDWRLGAIVIVACGALFGGDAIVDGAQTAIAVSP